MTTPGTGLGVSLSSASPSSLAPPSADATSSSPASSPSLIRSLSSPQPNPSSHTHTPTRSDSPTQSIRSARSFRSTRTSSTAWPSNPSRLQKALTTRHGQGTVGSAMVGLSEHKAGGVSTLSPSRPDGTEKTHGAMSRSDTKGKNKEDWRSRKEEAPCEISPAVSSAQKVSSASKSSGPASQLHTRPDALKSRLMSAIQADLSALQLGESMEEDVEPISLSAAGPEDERTERARGSSEESAADTAGPSVLDRNAVAYEDQTVAQQAADLPSGSPDASARTPPGPTTSGSTSSSTSAPSTASGWRWSISSVPGFSTLRNAPDLGAIASGISSSTSASTSSFMKGRWWGQSSVGTEAKQEERGSSNRAQMSRGKGGEHASSKTDDGVDGSSKAPPRADPAAAASLPRGSFPVSAKTSLSNRANSSKSKDAALSEQQSKTATVSTERGALDEDLKLRREAQRRERLRVKEERFKNIVEHDYSDKHALGAIASSHESGNGKSMESTTDTFTAFPQREYYVLSSAGKPIYVSTLSFARAKRSSSVIALRNALRSEREARRQARGGKTTEGVEGVEQEQEAAVEDELDEEKVEELRRQNRRVDDEQDEMATQKCAILQALVSNYAEAGQGVLAQKSCEVLRLSERERITFLLRAPLYLVCVSMWGEAEETRKVHLEHLHRGIIGLVSAAQLKRLFARAANFDLRRMLEGTDGLLDALVMRLQSDFSIPLGALQPLRMAAATRDDVASRLVPDKKNKPDQLLYIILLAKEKIITIARPKQHSVHPVDSAIIINTVYGTKALRESGSESWIPICLPKFAPEGFLHAHVSFLDAAEEREDELGQANVDSIERGTSNSSKSKSKSERAKVAQLALVMITADREGFLLLSAWRNSVLQSLREASLLDRLLVASLPHESYSANDLVGAAGLRHFYFKWRANFQITGCTFEHPYEMGSEENKRLMVLYSKAWEAMHPERGNKGRGRLDKDKKEENALQEQDHVSPAEVSSTPATQALKKSEDAESMKRYVPPSVLSTASRTSPASSQRQQQQYQTHQQHLLKGPSELIYAWQTPTFELYLTASPHMSKSALLTLASQVVRWVKKNETSCFIITSPTF